MNLKKIIGHFDGDFSTSTIKINDEPVNNLAESPEGLFFELPDDISGPVKVEVEEGGFSMEEGKPCPGFKPFSQ